MQIICLKILQVRVICCKIGEELPKFIFSFSSTEILDINYVDFLQFQRYFTPQAELEEAFIYIIHKPIDFSIDFSCRLKT